MALVFGFTLSGLVQSFLPRDGLRRKLGVTSPATVARASMLGLNIAATLVLVTLWLAARRAKNIARDPICGMTVDLSAPVAVRQHEGRDVYFCSLRCAERFDRDQARSPGDGVAVLDQIDPVCSMQVSSTDALSARGADGTTYYFCGEGCRRTFLASAGLRATQKPIQLGRKPPHE